MKKLPDKYYLAHFLEFLSFIKGPCAHLLDNQAKVFIEIVESLEEDAQCVLVRTMNRKSPYIQISSLNYEEIGDYYGHTQTLLEQGLLRPISDCDLPDLLLHLTKPQLTELLTLQQAQFKSSWKKQELIDIAVQHVDLDTVTQSRIYDTHVVRNYHEPFNYLLFLFFGDVSSRLDKFSMRDLGVMRTRKNEQAQTARYDSREEAQSSYFFASALKAVHQEPNDTLVQRFFPLSELPVGEGEHAKAKRDRFLFKLGKAIFNDAPDFAMQAWKASALPDAQEKWIRERYRQGDKEEVQRILNDIIDQPESEEIALFAEDFLARKFNKKRTSYLTDMLRKGERSCKVDEVYLNSVETGVKQLYQSRGLEAYKTENRLWRTIFGLTFWPELFELDEASLANEFDRRPRALVQRYFYERFETPIKSRLARVTDKPSFIRYLTQTATRHYGKSNGIFNWHPKALELIVKLIELAPVDALQCQLEAMAQHYYSFNDGFPDLMVIDNGKLRFEEIKAPGDQLRKNQLLTIRQLRNAGFDVGVTQVEWHIDPMQPYAVIDIETTGGRAANHRITEIGLVKVVNGEIVEEWQSLINPMRHIPRNITNLTGIDNEMVADAPLFTDVAETFRSKLEGCVFVAHNVNFDYGFIKQEYERLGQRFSMPKLCTVREMRKAVPGLRSYSLANLTEHFSITMRRHHRALSDAHAAAELLSIINRHRQNLSA